MMKQRNERSRAEEKPMDRREMREAGLPVHPDVAASLVSVASGAALGAAIGLFAGAGLPGVILGAIVGGAGGAGIAAYVGVHSKRERDDLRFRGS
jgi:hypothetical protein